MITGLLSYFQEFQKILVLCPECKKIYRLSELKLFYRGKVRHTWLDNLRAKIQKVERMEEKLEEEWDEIRQKAQEKGRKQLPKLLRKCVPVICRHGYYPQDLKPIFDPVDFIIFDGMNLKENVKRVVFFDGPPFNKRRERIQNSIQKTIKKGNYEWQIIKLNDEGKIV